MKLKLWLFVFFIVLFSGNMNANEVAEKSNSALNQSIDFYQCNDNCISTGEWQFGIAFGLGYISTPLADEEDIQLPVIPRFSYYNERFFIDNFTMGYSLYQGEYSTFDIIGEFNQDFLYFNTASSLQKAFVAFTGRDGREDIINIGDYQLKDRHATYLVGPSFRYQGEVLSLKASYTTDIFDLNRGDEITFEIGQQFKQGDWRFQHRLGVTRKSQKLVDYYYGLEFDETPEEAMLILRLEASYEAQEAAINTYYQFNTQYQISSNWQFLVSAKYEKLDDSITASPIIGKDSVESLFIGFGYDFD